MKLAIIATCAVFAVFSIATATVLLDLGDAFAFVGGVVVGCACVWAVETWK